MPTLHGINTRRTSLFHGTRNNQDVLVDTLRPYEAYMGQWTMSPLVQVMACSAPSHWNGASTRTSVELKHIMQENASVTVSPPPTNTPPTTPPPPQPPLFQCYPGNRPISQIPECICSISHNAPFSTEMCTFLFWMEHCGIWNRCILGFVNWDQLPFCSIGVFFFEQNAFMVLSAILPPSWMGEMWVISTNWQIGQV